MDEFDRYQKLAGIAEEIVQENELMEKLRGGERLLAYDGFEPSGLCHIPFAIYRPLLLKDIIAAGIDFKLLLADTFAWINGKMGGDIEKIRDVGRYFIEVWKAAGVDLDKVDIIWHKDIFDDPEYWKTVLQIAKTHTVNRSFRCLAIAGKSQKTANEMAHLFYPSMQCADIFYIGVDICQLGMDQRKVNMLAREIAPKLSWKKPICLHHHLLPSLARPVAPTAVFDEDEYINRQINAKMSKSKAETSIYIHDEPEEIRKKIMKAWCPPDPVDNPVLEYVKEITFRAFDTFEVGGRRSYNDYFEVEQAYMCGEISPKEMKEALYFNMEELVSPIRNHFKSGSAEKLYANVIEASKSN